MSVTVHVNTSEFLRSLKHLQARTIASLDDAVKATTLGVHQGAVRRAPVDMAGLKAGIHIALPKPLEGRVTVQPRYAPFVEFGTGPLGRGSNLTALAQEAMRDIGYQHGPRGGFPPLDVIAAWARRHGIPEDMAFPIAMRIRERGTRAQPFFFPAIEAERGPHERRVRAALEREFRAA